uniref:Uncharacterized protein n=1 Tax=Cyprinus carpio TaxID=7962 RepID=A0A8C1MFR5_CYPCA
MNLNNSRLLDSGVKEICEGLKNPVCELKILKLSNCVLTEESYSALASLLRSDSSSLKDLDLSNNNLQDSGIKLLSDGLKENCNLKKLRLLNCSITEEGYKALSSALKSNPSHLIELDLTGNDPGQSGVKQLTDLLQDPNCQLKLRFLGPAADEACQYVTGIVGKNPLLLRELNLSDCELGDTRVKQIAALLRDKHCQLNIIKLNNINITAEGCATLILAIYLNPSNLKELDLSGNKLGNSEIEMICHLLKNPQFRLEKLRLSDCSITGESYETLTSALRSNSYLIELDLTGNDPGLSGVKQILDFLKNEQYKLKKIRLLKSPAAEEACDYLAKVLGKNPLLLKELDLSRIELGVLDGEKLSALLMDSHSKVQKIKLNNCKLTEQSCSVLATVLSSKTILKELNLNNSRLLDSGVKEICEGLKNPVCELKILNLRRCNITKKQCLILTSALKSNLSHLRELDLSGNKIENKGVKHVSETLKGVRCKLERLRLLCCEMTDEGCSALTSALKSNPSHLRELDLSQNKLGDSGVKHLGVLLSSNQSRLEKLHLCGCSITEKQCLILTSALCLNLPHLKELDLSQNQIENTGVNHLCDVLKNTDCKLERLSLNDCGITDVACLAQSLADTKALLFLKELDLSNNKIGGSEQQLSDVLRDSNCKLR